MSLTSRLTLGFFVITLAALGVVFSYVIPTLESRLRDDKLHALEESARLFELVRESGGHDACSLKKLSTAARVGIPAWPPVAVALSAAAAEAKRMRSGSAKPRARAQA